MFCSDILKTLQGRLMSLGYYGGFVDGKYGPLTSNAIVSFKRDNGLRGRDYVGPMTLERLFSPDVKPKKITPKKGEPLWLTEARSLLNTNEYAGSSNNPKIMGWANSLDQWYPGDDIPWCGLFVAHCMAVGAPDEPQNFNRLGARNWLNYGHKVDPSIGAIAVFWRTHKTKSWNGHTGFLVGEDKTTYHVLGGNQSDSVNITRIVKSRLLGCVGPTDWDGGGKLTSVSTSSISNDEK